MNRTPLIWRMISLMLLSFGLVACDRLASQPIAIADLVPPTTEATQTPNTTEPAQNAEPTEKNVTVSGVIVRRVPLVNGAAYLLEDDTSTIWVRTDRPPDETEGEVIVSGILKSAGIDNRSAHGFQDQYIQEKTRRPLETSP